MKKFLLCAVVFVGLGCVSFAQPGRKSFSEETAKQFIHRFPDADTIRWGLQENSFSWQSGYLMFALEHLWRWTGDSKFYDYIKDFVDKNVDRDGHLRQFSPVTRKAYDGIQKKAMVNADGYINLTDCSSIGLQRDYESYISQPHEISTFAAYASFLLGTGIMEHRCPMTNAIIGQTK